MGIPSSVSSPWLTGTPGACVLCNQRIKWGLTRKWGHTAVFTEFLPDLPMRDMNTKFKPTSALSLLLKGWWPCRRLEGTERWMQVEGACLTSPSTTCLGLNSEKAAVGTHGREENGWPRSEGTRETARG